MAARPTHQISKARSGMSGALALARPQIGWRDVGVHFWQAKWLLASVFIGVFSTGAALAVRQPTYYQAETRLFVNIPDAAVNSGEIGALDQMVQTEIGLLTSLDVAKGVLPKFGLEALYPELASDAQKVAETLLQVDGESTSDLLRELGGQAIADDLRVVRAAHSPVINVHYRHSDRRLAGDVLNALVGEYLQYRADFFFELAPQVGPANELKRLEGAILGTQEEIRQLLSDADIRDFATDRAALNALETAIQAEQLANRSRARFVEGQIARLNQQLTQLPDEIELFTEDQRGEKLSALKLQREQLLSRYKDQADPVLVIDREIAALEAYQPGDDELPGKVRRGPNPVYQDVVAELTRFRAERRALSDQAAELARQQADIDARRAIFAELEPDWQALQRRKEGQMARAGELAIQLASAASQASLVRGERDRVKVLQAARPPLKGQSRAPAILIMAFGSALVVCAVIGIVTAFAGRGFVTGGAVERTTGLPVLAILRRRRS